MGARWAGPGPAYAPLETAPGPGEGAGPQDRKPQGGRWLLWLPVLVAGGVLYALNINNELRYHGPSRGHLAPMVATQALQKRASSFLVDSAGCRLPALDPWDPLIRQYVSKPKPLDCTRRHGPPLVASNRSALFVLEDALPAYNLTSVQDLDCCFQPFHRAKEGDNSLVMGKNCTAFEGALAVEAEAEFVRVECRAEGGQALHQDFHAFVPRKAPVEERCANASARAAPDEDAPSVLLLGIDAVSRLNFHRQMPRTAQLLSDLGAIELLGYNKVGDNTFPNLVPLLTGLSTKELRPVCWPRDRAPFDACPFVWKEYAQAGFRTAFGEDAPWMGIFNYVKTGFKQQPTDYYLRPFASLIEDRIGHTKQLNAKLCVGGRLTASVLLDYVDKFARTFARDRYFALFWGASLSHDFLNYPSLGDAMYERLLSSLLASGALDRTALILLSDHGIRWGGIRNTYQGRVEERLPFLYLHLPAWFRERYAAAVANAGRNARRLTTPFDVYATLLDPLRPRAQLTAARVRERSAALAAPAPTPTTTTPAPANATTQAPAPAPRGLSLFLQLPADRTCEQAGISPHWCTCQSSSPVDRHSAIVNRTAQFLVQHLNQILSPFRECAQLALAEVKDAQLETPQQELHKDVTDTGVHDYVLVVRTVPGDAVFEATVRHIPKSNNLTVAGYVSRLNLYGSQSACISNFHLKLYCYCTS